MRIVTTRRQHCDHCGRVTEHDSTTYYDDPLRPEEIVYCVECGE
ncbi:hypothetical protein [Haloactinopolyspora alba]|nr:hypothetical protein [Haloactinopolyspora alba]